MLRPFACAALLALGTQVLAAPVPKELRRPSFTGTWEIVSTNLWGEETPQYNGQRWSFTPEGRFLLAERAGNGYAPPRIAESYTLRPAGVDVVFGPGGVPGQGLFETEGDAMKLAFTMKNEVRPTDFKPKPDVVRYTFKRIRE